MSLDSTPSGADALESFFTDTYRHVDPLSGIDPAFVFEFDAYDELGDDQRWSTWLSVEPLQRGP
jgi:RIO kinase 1